MENIFLSSICLSMAGAYDEQCGGYGDGGSVPVGLARFNPLPNGDVMMPSFGMSPLSMWSA